MFLCRTKELPNIKVIQLNWVDTINQELDKQELATILETMYHCDQSVLVHCAQGKSRSGVICVCFLALLNPTVALKDIMKQVKSKRNMAEPNQGFVKQLHQFEKEEFFVKLHQKIILKN